MKNGLLALLSLLIPASIALVQFLHFRQMAAPDLVALGLALALPLVALLLAALLSHRNVTTLSRVVSLRGRGRFAVPRPALPRAGIILALVGGLMLGQAQATAEQSRAWELGALAPLFPYMVTALGGLSITVLGFLSAYLRQKLKYVRNQRLQAALEIVETLVFKKVQELMDNAVVKIKAASADGKLTADEARAAAQTAIAEVWRTLPAEIKALLARIAGSHADAQDQYLKVAVESAVMATKTYVPLPKAVTPAELSAARARIGVIR